MPYLKVANWNIEWMNHWFTKDEHEYPNFKSQTNQISNVCSLASRVANVIKNIDADIWTIQEGPSRKSEMNLFVSEFLDCGYNIAGPAGKMQQRIYALVKRNSKIVAANCLMGDLGFDFRGSWDVDINSDTILDKYKFTRPPLVLMIELNNKKRIRLLSLHLKSKYVHRGRAMWNDPAKRDIFIAKAIEARRRISIEAMRVREYINACFDEDSRAPIIVTGDFNDGPGIDYFERLYLSHNVASIISGNPVQPNRMLRHTFVDVMEKENNFTAEFEDFIEGNKSTKVLLDHIFVSSSLFWNASGERSTFGKIEHEIFDGQTVKQFGVGSREHMPSDHRPQSATLNF